MSGRRKRAPKYVGGCLLLPYDPSLCIDPESVKSPTPVITGKGGNSRQVTVRELLESVCQVFPFTVTQVRDYFYVLYPVSRASWLYSSSHTNFISTIYSSLNHSVIQKCENPMLDIGVFPVWYPVVPLGSYGVQSLTSIQSEALAMLVSVNDPSTVKFMNRRQMDGPVAFFRFLPDDERRETSTAFSDLNYSDCSRRHPSNFSRNASVASASPSRNPLFCILNEPHFGSSFSNAVYQLCRHRCSLTPHMVDVSQYLAENEANTRNSSIPQAVESSKQQLGSGILTMTTAESLDFFHSTLIGGTFDHLHAGHKILLSLINLISEARITIGVVSDEGYLLANKVERSLVQPFEYRAREVLQFTQLSLHLLNRPTMIRLPPHFLSQFHSGLCPRILTPPPKVPQQQPPKPTSSPRQDIGGRKEPTPQGFSPSVSPASIIDNHIFPPIRQFEKGDMRSDFGATQDSAKLQNFPSPDFPTFLEIEIIELLDAIGPAGDRSDFDCLVVTQDTRHGGNAVNEHRINKGLQPLKLIEFSLLEEDGAVGFSEEGRKTADADSCQADSVAAPVMMKEKISSSLVRRKLTSTPVIEDLRSHWDTIASTLELPKVMSSIWSIRLLEQFALPWRRLNRSRLHQMVDQLWNHNQPQIQANMKIIPTDKAWLSIVFWFSLCVISEETRSEQWKVEQKISKEKLIHLVGLFCEDYTFSMKMGLGPQIALSWRTVGSRLKPINRASLSARIRKASRKESEKSMQDNRKIETNVNSRGVMTNRNDSVVPYCFEIMDLRNNLISVGEYLLASFVPKHQQIDSSSAAPSPLGNVSSPKDLTGIVYEVEDSELKRMHGDDLLHNFQQTIDYFIYEFFQKSYRADYEPSTETVDSLSVSVMRTPLS